ncbi:MAG: EamA family transporter [Calditrichia bacterium]
MVYLFVVSLIWAFSFGLIKGNLTNLDPNFVSWARMAISVIIFLPLLRLKKTGWRLRFQLTLTGMVQYGVMYISYIYSFQYLKAYQVALFTIFTPIYVTLINDYLKGRFNRLNLLTALMAVIGTGIVVYQNIFVSRFILGFFIVQISNLCFAFGQIYYKHLLEKNPEVKDQSVFGLLFLGAFLITSLSSGIFTDWSALRLSLTQIWTLLYLGALASGICFFLWNYGARRVEAGTLAVFNDLKVPLAIFVSIVFFGEKGNILLLLLGGSVVMASLYISEFVPLPFFRRLAKTDEARS